MQDTKEYIIQTAFEVFLTKGYDSATMTVLQQELKMARGAMYRYFESKEDLFKTVIDRYFWGMIEFARPAFSDDMALQDRMDSACRNLKKLAFHLDKINGHEIMFLNYTAMVIQAAKHYPGFLERWKKDQLGEVKKWEKAIKNSIEKGEVRKDINVKITAHLFAKSFSGESVHDETGPGKDFLRGVAETRKVMDYIYSLIKV